MKPYGIRTMSDIRDRCRLVDDHWIWAGAKSGGKPRIWAADLNREGKMSALFGARAVWQIKRGKPIPAGGCVFVTCGEPTCVNPDHIVCRTAKQQGAAIAKSGAYKNQPKRIAANRAINKARTNVKPELLSIVLDMSKTGRQVVAETGICRSTVSRIRTAKAPVIAGPFAMFIHSLVQATS
jgi:hypothetical protein